MMNIEKRNPVGLFKGLLACAIASSPVVLVAQDEEEVFELSPFSVTAEDSIGYTATSTLAGTRIKTNLRDIGAAISVFTPEFLEDTGATDASTVLSYGLNTEVSGEMGNFAGGDDTVEGPTLDSQRASPQSNGQRIRGLAAASLTRGYFLTDIPFDSYNTDRVTINRGPNSLLFGVGSPGGIINNGVKQATLGDTFGVLGIRIGETGSHRETLDYNKVLVEDKLAVRFSILNEELEFHQKPAYEEDKRFYAAAEWVVSRNENSNFFGRTAIKANFEDGSIEGTPVNVIPPRNGYGGWFAPETDRSIEAITGVPLPGYIDNSHNDDKLGVFVPKTIIDTLPGAKIGRNGFPNSLSAWVNIPITWNDVNSPVPSVGLPGQPGVQGVLGRINWNKVPAPRGRLETLHTTTIFRSGNTPGFTQPVIMDTNVLDNRKLLLEGTTEFASHDWNATNFALEQALFNGKGGIEFVYDQQDYNAYESFPWDEDVRIDVSSHLTNDQPNPNVGRALIQSRGTQPSERTTTRESLRATAFYELDFTEREGPLGWFGNHTFTGLWNEQTIDNLTLNQRFVWDSVDAPRIASDIFSGNDAAGRRNVNMLAYITGDLRGSEFQSASDVRLTQPTNAVLTQPGDQYFFSWNDHPKPELGPGVPAGSTLETYVPGTGDPSFYNTFTSRLSLNSARRNEQVITSEAIAWQSRFWNGNIVGLVGLRTDESVNTGQASLGRGPEGSADLGQTQLATAADPLIKGSTRTNSMVVHIPDELIDFGSTNVSFHWNESENFAPESTRRDIRGNILSSPAGSTKEYGIGFEFKEGAISLRISKFEMSSANEDANLTAAANAVLSPLGAVRWGVIEAEGVPFEEIIAQATDARFPDAGTFNSYAELQQGIRGYLPPEIEALINARYEPPLPAEGATFFIDPIIGLTATRSFSSEGYEAELIGNLTKNWRMSLNVGQQETVTSNSAPILAEVAAETIAGMIREGVYGLQDAPDNDGSSTFQSRLNGATLIPLATEQAKDGTVSLEQREWRTNLATNYSYSEGVLKGFGVGGAWRYQSKAAVGYERQLNADGILLPVLDRAFFGPAETNIDLWASYSRPINDKITWKIQLNMRNALGDNDYIPVVINPDGRTAVVRNPNPKDIYLTNTFRF